MTKLTIDIKEEEFKYLGELYLQKAINLQVENAKLLEKIEHLEELLKHAPIGYINGQ